MTKISGDRDTVFAYAGCVWHAQSGLNLAVYRAYDPNLGRWLSRAPITENGGINLYRYVLNNPINFRDLLGLDAGQACFKGRNAYYLPDPPPLSPG